MSRTNTRGQGRGRGQIFEDKDEDKILASWLTCPQGLNITDVYLQDGMIGKNMANPHKHVLLFGDSELQLNG